MWAPHDIASVRRAAPRDAGQCFVTHSARQCFVTHSASQCFVTHRQCFVTHSASQCFVRTHQDQNPKPLEFVKVSWRVTNMVS